MAEAEGRRKAMHKGGGRAGRGLLWSSGGLEGDGPEKAGGTKEARGKTGAFCFWERWRLSLFQQHPLIYIQNFPRHTPKHSHTSIPRRLSPDAKVQLSPFLDRPDLPAQTRPEHPHHHHIHHNHRRRRHVPLHVFTLDAPIRFVAQPSSNYTLPYLSTRPPRLLRYLVLLGASPVALGALSLAAFDHRKCQGPARSSSNAGPQYSKRISLSCHTPSRRPSTITVASPCVRAWPPCVCCLAPPAVVDQQRPATSQNLPATRPRSLSHLHRRPCFLSALVERCLWASRTRRLKRRQHLRHIAIVVAPAEIVRRFRICESSKRPQQTQAPRSSQ
ncbi:hypothetical protein BC834DRAFT_569104 [Gloeopeniophorella convolvens]|nr:hypothetical protein BC834DRAFT_569104 [Gloeopeniophorella convolvens]